MGEKKSAELLELQGEVKAGELHHASRGAGTDTLASTMEDEAIDETAVTKRAQEMVYLIMILHTQAIKPLVR